MGSQRGSRAPAAQYEGLEQGEEGVANVDHSMPVTEWCEVCLLPSGVVCHITLEVT